MALEDLPFGLAKLACRDCSNTTQSFLARLTQWQRYSVATATVERTAVNAGFVYTFFLCQWRRVFRASEPSCREQREERVWKARVRRIATWDLTFFQKLLPESLPEDYFWKSNRNEPWVFQSTHFFCVCSSTINFAYLDVRYVRFCWSLCQGYKSKALSWNILTI